MCVCACASVSVCLPIKGDSRFGDSLDSCCLLCSLRGDEQMVCWSVVRRTHAGRPTHPHANTNTHMHALSCHLSFILHLSFPLHVSRQDNATLWAVRVGGSCAFERDRKDTRQREWSGKASLRGGHLKKLMTHLHIGFCESLLFTRQPLCIQQELLATEALFSCCLSARVRETKHGTFGQGRMSENLATAKTRFTRNKWR